MKIHPIRYTQALRLMNAIMEAARSDTRNFIKFGKNLLVLPSFLSKKTDVNPPVRKIIQAKNDIISTKITTPSISYPQIV